MKRLIYVLVIYLLAVSCEKYDSEQIVQSKVIKKVLTESELNLKENLNEAAKILTDVIQDDAVINELSLISDENRTFFSLSFKDLLYESKGNGESFPILKEKFKSKCSSIEAKGGSDDLGQFLVNNNCYIYCPYPSCFYQKGKKSYTIASHPIDNEEEGVGYRNEGRNVVEVTVNEDYADKNQVLLVMPKDEDLESETDKGASIESKATVYEVRIGKIRCADYCGGIFEGTLEIRISRGYPEYNMTTGAVAGKFTTVIPINYPRDYAKAAKKGWTSYKNGGWFSAFLVWDSNWNTTKAQQCILVYEYDKVSEKSLSTSLGYKPENSTGTMTITAKVSYSGDFLGLCEWDRDWFYATNTNPGYNDEVKDGWTVRKTCPEFKLTTPDRTLN